MKLTGYNHHQHHKLFPSRSRVKDTINNGIQRLGRLRDRAMDAARKIHGKVESTAGKIDSGVKTAYAAYGFLEPFLPLTEDQRGTIRGYKTAYNAASYAAQEIWNNPVRELGPVAARGFANMLN